MLPHLPQQPKRLVSTRNIQNLGRKELIKLLENNRSMHQEWVRRLITVGHRIDVLAELVLGYKVCEHHLRIIQHQYSNPWSQTLVWRGAGKCLAPGTPVLMFDGSIKPVEKIRVGDQVMGPDSKPRNVLALGHGHSDMYEVMPTKGEPWGCNADHLISLKGRDIFRGRIREFTPVQLLEKKKRLPARGLRDIPWKLFRVGVDFPKQLPPPLDPYFFGFWLGDGTEGEAELHKPDQEIHDWAASFAKKEGYQLTILRDGDACPRLTIGRGKGQANPIRRYLRSLGSKHIPDSYLLGSREVRLQLLAGLIDSDGWMDRNFCEISQKREILAKQIIFLARSLGFAAYLKQKVGTIKRIGFTGIYHSVSISGHLNQVPTKIRRKQATPRLNLKDVQVVGFDIRRAGFGEYFGFSIDGDGRFLLGDFTVTHNTTIATVTWAIWQILLNRDRRILLASKTSENAKDFLKEIKRHFEANERLREIFGDFVGTERWDATAIEVKGRSKPYKEPTINTIGLEGAVASKHYDTIIADDLVDEENSRTKYQREKMLDWFYKMLIPCINPPGKDDPLVGRLHVVGTRYHYDDLYGHLMEDQSDGTGGEMKGDKSLVIPVIHSDGTPVWPDRFPVEQIQKLKSMGLIRFNTQYMCDCEAMKGQIFRYDDCRIVDDDEIPNGLRIFMGVDLAISEEESADMFAIVVIGRDAGGMIYVLDYMEAQLRFPQQTEAIIGFARRSNAIRIGIEANAYQKAQIHQLKQVAPDLNVHPIYTLKDKVTRAWNLAKHFETGRVRFKRGMEPLIEHLVLFPGYRFKDMFDAFSLAVETSEMRQRKQRDNEPGLI